MDWLIIQVPYFEFSHIGLEDFSIFLPLWTVLCIWNQRMQFIWMHYMLCYIHICICMQRQRQSVSTATWPTAIINSTGFRNVKLWKNTYLQPTGYFFTVKALTFPACIWKATKEKLFWDEMTYKIRVPVTEPVTPSSQASPVSWTFEQVLCQYQPVRHTPSTLRLLERKHLSHTFTEKIIWQIAR